MLRVTRQNITRLKYPVYSSLALSFASLGDAFMYPFLPQNAALLNIPVVWIGILLSINRLIRIVFNPFVMSLLDRYGVRQVTMTASFIAVLSTIGYSLGLGLGSLVLFRILWGIAFTILRISTAAYALEHANIGISLGISRSIQELGPLFALWVGPVLLTYFPGEMIFLCLGILSLPSLLYAYRLPRLATRSMPRRDIFTGWPSLFNTMTFFLSFIVEGVLIVLIGLILLRNNMHLTSWMLTSLAASLLAYRRICFILLSPVSGVIAEKVGFTRIFNMSVLLIVMGIVFVLAGWEIIGLAIVFAFNSANSAMAPGGVSNKQEDKLHAVTVNAGWRDIGAASGTLAGGFLLSASVLSGVLLLAIFILLSVLFLNFIKSKSN